MTFMFLMVIQHDRSRRRAAAIGLRLTTTTSIPVTTR
jgi:hypothetical protein